MISDEQIFSDKFSDSDCVAVFVCIKLVLSICSIGKRKVELKKHEK